MLGNTTVGDEDHEESTMPRNRRSLDIPTTSCTGPHQQNSISNVFNIESFDNSKIPWTRWIERFEGALDIFNVSEDKKVRYLLHYMGPETYDVICDKLTPKSPNTEQYEVLVKLLQEFYDPAPLEIAEIFRFHRRKQEEGENIQDFLKSLQKLSIHCNFGNYLTTAIRNQFVFGLFSVQIQNRLLETRNLTLDRAVEVAVAMELSARNTAEFHSQKEGNLLAFSSQSKENKNILQKSFCFRCGDKNHFANNCKKTNLLCSFCHRKGHLQKVCRKVSNTNTFQFESQDVIQDIVALESEQDMFREKFIQSFIVDNKKIEFLVDSGAAVTVMGKRQFDLLFPNSVVQSTNLKLISYCQNSLTVLGFYPCKVKFRNTNYCLNLYVVACDREPLVGREWIRQIKLNLFDNVNNISPKCSDIFEEFSRKYANVFCTGIGKFKGIQVRLVLKENVIPSFFKARPIPFSLMAKADEEIEKLVSEGILTKVNRSEWATPIVPVVKSNGSIRICGDFRLTVNKNLKVDNHPLPTVDELFHSLAGGQKFTKLDLSQAYLHMEVHPDDRHLLTLNTHKGLYECNRLMFGISSAPAIFQREMEILLKGIPGVSVYLDDIKVTGETDAIHLERLHQVFERLSSHDLHINKEKSIFFADKIEYCGYIIDSRGIHKIPAKINTIIDAPQPKDKTQLRSFLGLINYYGRFLKNLSTILFPLTRLLHKNSKFVWSRECEQSFKNVKQIIAESDFLTHFDSKLPLILATDASPYGVGAVLSHKFPDGSERPIQFASQTLSLTQQKYSQIDREAYGIIFGVRKFYQYLFGNRFTLITDHKPLLQIFSLHKTLPTLTATRMQHYAIYLQSFNYDIQYRSSKEHGNADFCSRLPLQSETLIQFDALDLFEIKQIETLPVSFSQIAYYTERDKLLQPLLDGLKTGKEIQSALRFGIPQTEFSLQQGCLIRGVRVVIPKFLQSQILEELHTAHFGITKMKNLARGYCWWSGIDHDIEKLVNECLQCKKIQNNPTTVPVHSWEETSFPFERVHIDYMTYGGQPYFILVDAFSRWPEVYLTHDMSSKTTIKICREIFSRFGMPKYIVSDNGRQFLSHEFKEFLRNNGIKQKLTAPYHPATNGLAERFVQTIKQAIRATNSSSHDREKELYKILLQFRKMPHTATNKSPSALIFNREIRSRLDVIKPEGDSIHDNVSRIPKHCNVRTYELNTRIMVRNYSDSEKWVFGLIIRRLGNLHYLIKLDDGRVCKRHVNQLRS